MHIAYLPQDGVVGLSKLARLVEVYARRLQVQENMTAQIIDALNEHLNPRGAAVLIEAEHMCMSMRGVRAHGAQTIDAPLHRRCFAEERDLQDRFFAADRQARLGTATAIKSPRPMVAYDSSLADGAST